MNTSLPPWLLFTIGAVGLAALVTGLAADAEGWWSNRPFLTNLVSSIATAGLGVPITLLVIDKARSRRRNEAFRELHHAIAGDLLRAAETAASMGLVSLMVESTGGTVDRDLVEWAFEPGPLDLVGRTDALKRAVEVTAGFTMGDRWPDREWMSTGIKHLCEELANVAEGAAARLIGVPSYDDLAPALHALAAKARDVAWDARAVAFVRADPPVPTSACPLTPDALRGLVAAAADVCEATLRQAGTWDAAPELA